MATVDLSYLSWKVAFLVAVTSAQRSSELCALHADEPYLRFHLDKVVLRTDIAFLPKVATAFHIEQDIVLPAFFFQAPSTDTEWTLHLLDVRRALAFYLDRTKDFRKSPRLFLKYRNDAKGLPVSPQCLSASVVSTIKLAYQMAGRDPPPHLRSHSTRAVAISAVYLHRVPLQDICWAAIWATLLTFATHYKMDFQSRRHTTFGRAVLFSALA
nr:PREDICTED: uncharacterized protein LOC107983852 [Anolis carolinensis]|eukprot:XP_016854678.1 PREDICTED: uncharacterized protein LOC107983852 [Anolis carolinensis]